MFGDGDVQQRIAVVYKKYSVYLFLGMKRELVFERDSPVYVCITQ